MDAFLQVEPAVWHCRVDSTCWQSSLKALGAAILFKILFMLSTSL